MRKLVFMLKVNPNPRATTPKNLEISTHKGARLTIVGNQATVLDVTADEMSDTELQNWYRSRYSGLGMGISILKDKETEIQKPVGNFNKSVEASKGVEKAVKDTKTKTRRTKKQSESAEIKNVTKIEAAESSVISKVESKEIPVIENKSEEVKVEESKVEEINNSTEESAENTVKEEKSDVGAFADLQSFLWS